MRLAGQAPSPRACARIGQVRAAGRALSAYTGDRNGHLDGDDAALLAASFGALLKALRADRRMSSSMLARRSAVASSTVSRLENGLRRPRQSLLGNLAYGLEPDCPKPYAEALAAAAGPFLAEESQWSERMHRRRLWAAMISGDSPLPEAIAYPLRLHQAADKLWRQAMGTATGDWLDSAEALDRMGRLLDASRRLRAEAGPVITTRIGKRYRISAGIPSAEGL